ncbi:hypothetical protein V2J09_005615 [Rumex salicifolius]
MNLRTNLRELEAGTSAKAGGRTLKTKTNLRTNLRELEGRRTKLERGTLNTKTKISSMAFNGFGRQSGPGAPPKSLPLFGPPPSTPPPSTPAADLPASRMIRSYRDLDALEDVPVSSSPYNAHPTMGFIRPSATLDGESFYQEGGQKRLADKDFSKQMQRSPSAVDTEYSQPRTQLLVPRPQIPQQLKSPSFPYPDSVGGSAPKKKVFRITDFPSHLVQSSSENGSTAGNYVNKNTSPTIPKRSRSPPPSASQVFLGNSNSTDGDDERELEAKAKRLARFKTDLSVPAQKFSSINDPPKLDKQKGNVDYLDSTENDPIELDVEGPKPPGVIVGLCSDMCPVSEREERERKGDLDQYERLDGDRNQSGKGLAVKKYTRTAERAAELIRPLPILKKTMDYLLNLLDRPYGDSFLGLYNFLWDRMRAIRMDLRMQHIFNLEAITMLEQMIRLHIVAMHELCEYTKGEGFSEGFDAHLNIEQMNKTSVELFQLYDDYRKKGVDVPTEKEFRGYYALLKLDKHPGYKVEPAELSLDLAKMTPEIRQTQEVLLARDVARSCRTVNFIAFFRLGVKASYLQACLMHAHFSKLRTQALASLHSGLQNNQGIPVALVAKWLGLESEGVESLLEYHGFSIKEFDELYMVKDGPFLNTDKDFPTKCSELVHSKKSKHIVEDVSSPHQLTLILPKALKEFKPVKVKADKPVAVQSIPRDHSLSVPAKKVSEFRSSVSPKHGKQLEGEFKRPRNQFLDQANHPSILASPPKETMQVELAPHVLVDQHIKTVQNMGKRFQSWNSFIPKPFAETQQICIENHVEHTPGLPSPAPNNVPPILQQMPMLMSTNVEQEHIASADVITEITQHDMVSDNASGHEYAVAHNSHEEEPVAHCYDEEVAKAKIRLFLRLWKRRCATKRELREQNRLAANAALNSLSVGPPIQHKQERRNSYERFDIDEMMNKRYKKHEESWSRFCVSDLVTDVLCIKNPRSSCICWKVVVCTNIGLSGHAIYSSSDKWLHSKLMPSTEDEFSNDLVISSPGLAIWRKWVNEQSQSACCMSVIKSINLSNLNEDVSGSNGVVFLLSEDIELENQKVHLQNLVASLPYGSCMPLLLLSSLSEEDFADQSSAIADKLGLPELDKSRISSYLIVTLHESHGMEKLDGYFSDKRLKEGLKWLASMSYPQPVLWYIKTRELVMSHLNTSLNTLDHMKVGPNQCISAFNDALDKSIEDIVSAANANPSGWPCPELLLLHDELKLLLPSIGWSSSEAIEPLLSVLRRCKLPVFLDDTSFLNRGSMAGDELEEIRLHLQDCLISYLNQSSKMMNLTMAMKEASLMLQKNARLELHSRSYYVVPNWVLIFRRVFNWRLNVLSSKAYILEKQDPPLEKSEDLDLTSNKSYIDQPSLDEMMEVSFTSPAPMRNDERLTGEVAPGNNLNEINEASPLGLASEHSSHIQLVQDYTDVPLGRINMKDSSRDLILPAREVDRLTRLLEQCNRVQNKIGEKLSIYF